MILSNLSVHKALDEGRLVISPEPTPRTPELGKICPYDTHSVDLRLHEDISVPESGSFAYDLTEDGKIAEFIAKNCDKKRITEDQPYTLKGQEFILARTFEHIELRTDKGTPYLAARIEGKSSRARCGILVHFTAPTVHPDWSGPLTLEMINLGPTNFLLYPEMFIAQLIIEEVTGELVENQSQFQDQSTPEGT